MKEVETALTSVKGRWMTGLDGLSAAPSAWKDQLGSGTEAELRLLALTGQALQVAFKAKPPEKLSASPALPGLSLPTMPDAARVFFRRILAEAGSASEQVTHVLEFIAARGYAVHPLDWMPKAAGNDVPSLYTPWLNWLKDTSDTATHEALNNENWDEWSPAMRRHAFADLRATAPDTARDVLAANATKVPAEERLRLVQLLGNKLSDDDVECLEGLCSDRSAKVRFFSSQLLARLGAGNPDAELTAELTDTLELKRAGLISRQKILVPKKLKNQAQRNRRLELLPQIPLHSVATAFDLTPKQAVEQWDLSADGDLNTGFAIMVANTGDDEVQLILAQRLLKTPDTSPVYQLIPRLTDTDRKKLLTDALALDGDIYQLATKLSQSAPGQLPFDELVKSADYKALLKTIEQHSKANDNSGADGVLSECLSSLGLLLDQPGAVSFIDISTTSGLLASDPHLTMLQMNAALPTRSQQ